MRAEARELMRALSGARGKRENIIQNQKAVADLSAAAFRFRRAAPKTKRPPLLAAVSIVIIVMRNSSSLAGLAATYSSKP